MLKEKLKTFLTPTEAKKMTEQEGVQSWEEKIKAEKAEGYLHGWELMEI